MHPCVQSSAIRNRRDMGTISRSINGGMDKEDEVHADNGIPLRQKKSENMPYIEKNVQIISIQIEEFLQNENTHITTTQIKRSNIASILPLKHYVLHHPKVIPILFIIL